MRWPEKPLLRNQLNLSHEFWRGTLGLPVDDETSEKCRYPKGWNQEKKEKPNRDCGAHKQK
jgi:hypothetical protein